MSTPNNHNSRPTFAAADQLTQVELMLALLAIRPEVREALDELAEANVKFIRITSGNNITNPFFFVV